MSSVLIAWLGEGGAPVSQELAEARASVCKKGYYGEKCPSNVEPNWWGRVKHAAAETIKTHLQAKNGLKLVTSNESELGMCKTCGCCLPLKVWVPVQHVKEHMSPEMKESLPPWCWQKIELEGTP